MSQQEKAIKRIIANVNSGVSVTYLTGNAGTGKTYTAQQLVEIIRSDEVLEGWNVLDCAPQGKASDIAAGGNEGTTMQSLFKINNRNVLPVGVTYLKYHSNRDPISEVVTQAKKSIAKKLGLTDLKRAKIFLYIEEVMAASAEDLATVRMIMQDLAKVDLVQFHILAVGHPLQNIDCYKEEIVVNGEILGHNYRTPAFKSPQWDNGNPYELVTHHSFFENNNNWTVDNIVLTENKRQGTSDLGILLDKWATGQSIGKDLMAVLPASNIHTFAYGMKPENLKAIETFITPSLVQERKINSTLLSKEGAFVFLPYFKLKSIEGYVLEYNAKRCSIKLAHDPENWVEIPDLNKPMFRQVMRNLPVDLENVLVPNHSCLFRNNGANFKNGTMGVVKSFSTTEMLVEVEKENGENIVVEYIRSKELKDNSPFEFMYLPLMSIYGVTTGKVQGCTYNHAVGVCIDARNNNPKPHAAYVAMSRVTRLEDLHIVISNVATNEGVDLSRAEMIDQAMTIDTEALEFHTKVLTGAVINDDCANIPNNSTVVLTNNETKTENPMNSLNDFHKFLSKVPTCIDENENGEVVSVENPYKAFLTKVEVETVEEYDDYTDVMNTPDTQAEIEALRNGDVNREDIPTPITMDILKSIANSKPESESNDVDPTDIPTPTNLNIVNNATSMTNINPAPSDIPSATILNVSELTELNKVNDELIDQIEANEMELEKARTVLNEQAKQIEALKAQLAKTEKVANDALIQVKAAKEETAKAKVKAQEANAKLQEVMANSVSRDELLAMRAILDRALGFIDNMTPAQNTTVESIPEEVTPEVETKTLGIESNKVAEAKVVTPVKSTLTYAIKGDETNIKLKGKVAILTQAGFVRNDAEANLTLTTEGVSNVNTHTFNINQSTGRLMFDQYVSTLTAKKA